jgi:hypothetical protein
VVFIAENGGGPGRTTSKAAKAEALRTGPDAFLRNEANLPGATTAGCAQAAGVEFIDDSGGRGVRIWKPAKPKR